MSGSYCLQQRREGLVDRFASPKDSRPDGADRAFHGLRDLFVAEAFDFTKQNGGAELFGQRMNGAVDRVANLLGLDERLGSVELAQLVQDSGLLRVLSIEVVAHGLAPRCDEMVLRGVDRDSIEPRVERAIAPERRGGAIRLQERFLRDIESFGRVTNVSHDELDDLVLV